MSVFRNEEKQLCYHGDTFKITMTRYSDPERLNLARNAALYLGKSDTENVRRPLSIVKQGHVPAIFRGEHVEFIFEGVSKEVYDHLITYTTATMRATGGNRALTSNDYTMPGDKMKNPEMVEEAINESMNAYKALVMAGETKQVARSAMPVSAKMNKFVFQFNFLTLGESVFKQRLWEKGAQGNTVKVVQGMFALCQTVDCVLWDTFYNYVGTPAIEWGEVRKRLMKNPLTIQDVLNDGQNGDKNIMDFLLERYGGQKSMW